MHAQENVLTVVRNRDGSLDQRADHSLTTPSQQGQRTLRLRDQPNRGEERNRTQRRAPNGSGYRLRCDVEGVQGCRRCNPRRCHSSAWTDARPRAAQLVRLSSIYSFRKSEAKKTVLIRLLFQQRLWVLHRPSSMRRAGHQSSLVRLERQRHRTRVLASLAL